MKVEIYKDYEALSQQVGMKIAKQLNEKPHSLICIAGGDTPLGLCNFLIQLHQEKRCDFTNAMFISLDEWVGLGYETQGSCKQTLYDSLFTPLELKENQIHFFDGKNTNLEEECEKMNQVIEENHGIDLIVLGIGMNGHLGFNEPGIRTEKATVVPLADKTKEVSVKYFHKELPLVSGITLGMDQIKEAKTIILMAASDKKKEIVKATVQGAVSNQVPSSLLQETQAILCVDEEAGKELV